MWTGRVAMAGCFQFHNYKKKGFFISSKNLSYKNVFKEKKVNNVICNLFRDQLAMDVNTLKEETKANLR